MREFSNNFKMEDFLASVQAWHKEISLRSATLEYRWCPFYEEIRYTSGSRNTFCIIRKTKKVGFLLCSAERVYKWWKEPDDTDSDLEDHTQKLEQELEEAVSSSSSPMKVFILDEDETEDIKPFKSKDIPTGYIPVAMAIEV